MDGDALVGIFAAGVAVPEMLVHFYQRYAEGLGAYLGTEEHARCELLVDRQTTEWPEGRCASLHVEISSAGRIATRVVASCMRGIGEIIWSSTENEWRWHGCHP